MIAGLVHTGWMVSSGMAPELAAHQLHHFGIVAEAGRCSSERNKAFSAGHVVEQRLRLLRRD